MSRLQDRREKESFFNFFYLSINLGSLLAVTVLVYIQVRIRCRFSMRLPACDDAREDVACCVRHMQRICGSALRAFLFSISM